MSEVNLSLKFQATNTSAITRVVEDLDKIQGRLNKKFKVELDIDSFVTNLNSLKSSNYV
jgi:hypothetical protein